MNIAIIGGGYTGLVAAIRFLQNGHQVQLFEKSPTLGGMAAVFEIEPSMYLEYFYHHLFTNDNSILDLADELGIDDQMKYHESVMGMYSQGDIYNFTTPVDLLKFKPLSFVDRIKFGLGALRLKRIKDWKPLEDITAVEAMPEYVGRGATEVIWKPLLKGKFGEHFDEVSMVWLWGKIALRGGSRKQGGAKECLIYPEGSFKTITDRLEKEIEKLGGVICTGSEVTQVVDESGEVKGLKTSQGDFDCDVLLHTTMSGVLTKMAPGLPTDYAENLNRLKYMGAVCLILEMDRPFSHIYWMNNGDTSLPFGGLIEHTNLIPPEHYGGRRLLYVSRYADTGNPVYRVNKDEALELFLPAMQKINPHFQRSHITGMHLFRYPYAQPIIEKHYSEMLPDFSTPIRGLYIANLSQIYPEDRGTNYAVRLGNQVAEHIMNERT